MPRIPTWQFRTLKDAYQPRPPLEFAIDQILMMPSLNIVYGPPGSLKSMLLADACLCVALGCLWLDGLLDATQGIKTQQMPVMWLDFDNGARRTDERFDALGRARNAPESTELAYVSMPTPWLDCTNTGMVANLIDTIKDVGARFVVLDNLGVISGNADENTVEMVQVMQNLRMLAEYTGATVNVIHHQRKGNGNTSGSRQGDSLRGHSSIEAAIDLALQIEREPNSSSIEIKATKSRGFDVRPFSAVWTYTHKPGTTELAEARFYGMQSTDDSSDYAIEDAIMDALCCEGDLNQSAIVQEVQARTTHVGVHRIRGVLASMTKANKIACDDSAGRGGYVYSLCKTASWQQTQLPSR